MNIQEKIRNIFTSKRKIIERYQTDKLKNDIDDELNIQIKKALRKKGIAPTNKIIKRITRVNCADNPLCSFYFYDYEKPTQIKLLAIEVKLFDNQDLQAEFTHF